MSFDFRTVRQPTNDPVLKYITSLQKQMVKFLTKDQINQLEGSEDIFGDVQDINSGIKLQTDLNGATTFEFDKEYYPPSEPDNNKLKLWIKGYNLGNYMHDFAQFGNVTALNGDPILVDGAPFDYGIHTYGVKSVCLRFNRPTSTAENQEYIRVDDNARLRVQGIGTGNSYFIRFKIYSLVQQGGIDRTLFAKKDNNTPTDGVMLKVGSDGRLKFHIKKSGIEYNRQTSVGVITTDTVYDVWVTYTVSGSVQKIYINNVDQSLSDPGAAGWSGTSSLDDMFVFRRGSDSSGYVYGDLYDFEMFQEKVVSATEVGRHYTNKWTIADIPFGQVIVSNYWATYGESTSLTSFTSGSFTTTSFT